MSGPLSAGQVTPAAAAELAAWEALAADWPVYQEGPCARCASCHMCVIRTHDGQGTAYAYSDANRLALAVAHLRQAHQNLAPA